ncbi:ribosome biogenesis GTPase YlqF [Pelomonas sp. V22]|uniref:ribosome biogenesis GTPase YlqF n=1 Tax=Pelomonas sp. V22 TaxID=2822139 RepID=UPI0024A8FE88|nr:ribosome biogenesis GTPase YlqF [Pelomonas sp. V22]MDI4632768.1 ribosome biogenesis GTPase YlqF [Pelomonas sp. V22]
MAIQWFPGHMNSTRNAIKERMKGGIDVVIELLDARLPGSSSNPLLRELTEAKPSLKVLNKQDLADPARNALWLAHFQAMPETRAMVLDTSMVAPAKALAAECRALAPNRGGMAKPLRVLICGIPNVGKSTLINTLMGKKSTKTGDEPGITKVEQKLVLENDFYLFDTPGMLWPRISVAQSGYNLAASGAIGRNAFSEEEVALELLTYLRHEYPAAIEGRYKLGAAAYELDDEGLLTAIGRKRGAVMSGGRVNLQKASEVLIYEFRQGILGRITLETPEQFAQWCKAAEASDAARAQKLADRKARRKGVDSRAADRAARAAAAGEDPGTED